MSRFLMHLCIGGVPLTHSLRMEALQTSVNTEIPVLPMHHELSNDVVNVRHKQTHFGSTVEYEVPQPPHTLDAASYEAYISEIKKHVVAPAIEYTYDTNDPSSSFPVKGLAMAADSFPGLKKQIEYIVDHGIVGDIYETGTWRGGTSIYMLAVLRAYEKLKGKESGRSYFGFDSFEGFRPQGIEETLDDYLSEAVFMAPLEKVQASFEKFGLLDDRVHFVKGYFEDSVPKFKLNNSIAILRLDGDLYSSTKVVLDNLYPHVQIGGWTIIDDYDWRPEYAHEKLCREAVDEYRNEHNVNESLTSEFGNPRGKKPSWMKDHYERI